MDNNISMYLNTKYIYTLLPHSGQNLSLGLILALQDGQALFGFKLYPH